MKLTDVHRFAIKTAGAVSPGDPPALLPEGALPRHCCHNMFRCNSAIRWRIGGGYFCQNHADLWWEQGRYIGDYKVYRVW